MAAFVRTRLTFPAPVLRWLRAKSGSHHLPRLDRSFYRAFAAVHWRMRVEPCTPGWLNDCCHLQFRELLLHACVREKLCCPTYCLMPDHLHLMWLGLAVQSDQRNGIKFLRTHLNRLLAGEALPRRNAATEVKAKPTHGSVIESAALSRAQPRWHLQPQAFDHVLREDERNQGAFASVCSYILANPVRAGLVEREADWAFSGAMLPGYPDLYPLRDGYWELFWKLYYEHREPMPQEAPAAN